MKKLKKWLKITACFMVLFFISSCTANFCSNKDKAEMWYKAYGNEESRTKLVVEAQKTMDAPHPEFWKFIENKTLEAAKLEAESVNVANDVSLSDKEITDKYGYVMFLDNQYGIASKKRKLWSNWDAWVAEAKISESVGIEKSPNKEFANYYKTTVAKASSGKQGCITPVDGEYGPEGSQIPIEGKSWADAWDKGVIEGLLVYPVSILVHTLSNAFGNNGWGQLAALAVTTIIIRGLLLLATFKSTMATQKMSALQPELAKIQAKYPNANSNQYEKTALANEQMALYKRNKINPFSQIIVMILQFPVFIAVWGAMQGSAIMSSGTVLGLNLNAPLGTTMINFSSGAAATAIILFLLMSTSQLVSMKLPQWIQKKKTKQAATKLGKNPASDTQGKQMKMVSNIMLVMIIVMGISLPSAMGVYWLIGALISITQTLIMQKVMAKRK